MKSRTYRTLYFKSLLLLLFFPVAFKPIVKAGESEKIMEEPQAQPTIQPANAKFCSPGGWLYVSDIPNNADSFVWYRNGISVGVDNDSLFISTIGQFTYSCVLFNNKNKLDSIFVQATVNQNPKADFSFNPAGGCGKTKINFTDKSTPTGFIQSWSWNFGDPGSGNNTSNSQNPAHTFKPSPGTGSQSYAVTLTVKHDNGCVSTKDTVITIGRGPDASLNGNPTLQDYNGQPYFIKCLPSNLTSHTFFFVNQSLTSATNTGYLIKWGDGSQESLTNAWVNGSITSHTYQIGIYKLTFLVFNGTCVDSIQYNVFVGSNPGGSISSPSSTYGCTGETFSFPFANVSNNSPGTMYVITVNDGSDTVRYTQENLPPVFTHTFNKSSCGSQPNNTFTVSYLITNPCSETPGTIGGIRISQKAEAEFAVSPDDTVCQNTNIQFTSIGEGGLIVPVTGGAACKNGNAIWTITPSSGWSVVSGSLGSSIFKEPNTWISGSNSISINFSLPGSYEVKLKTGTDECGVDSITKEICVNPIPTASFSTNRDSICPGETVVASSQTNLGSCGVNRFKWTIAYTPVPGCLPSSADYAYINSTDSTKQNPQIRFNGPGIYTLSLQTFAPGLACSSAVVSKQIVVRGKPIVSVSGLPLEVCATNQPLSPSGSATCFIDANSTFFWTFPTGTSPFVNSSQATPGAITLPVGSSSVRFKATNICGSDSITRMVKVTAPPIATISYANGGAFCNSNIDSQFVTITGVKNGTFSSTSGLIINPATGAVVPSLSTPGTYTVTYTIAASGGCSVFTTTAIITITAAPSGSFSYSGSYCNTISNPVNVTFSNLSSAGTFNSSPAGLNIITSTGTINPSLSTPGSYLVFYTLPAAGGCASYSPNAVNVQINRQPVIIGPDSVCKLSTISLTADSIASTSNPWTTSNNAILTVSGSGVVTGVNAGSASVFYLDENGCSDTIQVKVNELPVITGPNDVCVGSKIKLVGKTPAYSVNPWTSSDPTIATVVVGVGSDTGIITGIKVGVVNIKYKNSSNCSATHVVNVRPVPVITGDTTSPIKCNDPSGKITISGLAGSTSYTLYYNNGSPIPIISTATGQYEITGLKSGTYSNIYIESQYNCKSNILGFNLVDPNPPSTPLATNDTVICSGNSVILSVTSTKPNIKYYWNGPGLAANTLGTSININNAQTTASGKYYVIADSVNCKSNPDSINLTVYPTPPIPIVVNQINYCQFDVSTPLSATVAAGSTLIWYDANKTVLPSAPIPSTNIAGSFKYYVSQRNISDTCQSQKDSILVIVKPKPKITGYKINPVNCATPTGIIILKGLTPGNYQVKYDTSGVPVVRNINTANDSLIVDNLVAHTYSNIHVLLSGCPSDTINQFILSDPNPPDTPKLQSNSPICSGNTINVSVDNTVTGGVYLWSGPKGSVSGASGPSISVINSTTADSGLYKVTVTLNNCKSIAGEINVIVNQTPPALTVTTPIYYCKGDIAQALTANTIDVNHFLRWYIVASGGAGSSIAPVPSTQTTGTTTYYVSQISSDSCEGPRVPINVVIREIPEITDMNKPVCSGEKIFITPSGPGVPANTQYYWYMPVVSNSDSLKDASSDSLQTSFHDTLSNVSDFVQTALYTVYPVTNYIPTLACPGKPFKIDVTVNPSPKIRFSIPNDTICSGDQTKQVTLISPTPGAVISWNSPSVTGISGNNPSGNNIIPVQTLDNSTVNPLVVKYIAQAVNSGGFSCPGIPSTYEVTVAPKPEIKNKLISICSESSIEYNPVLSQPPNRVPVNTKYTWTISADNSNIKGQNGQSDRVSVISDTLINTSNVPQKIVYTVQSYSGDLLGCSGDPFTIEVTVNPTPVILPLYDTICSGNSFDLKPSNAFPDTLVPVNTTYSWLAPAAPTYIRGLASGNSQVSIKGLLYNDSYAPYTVTYKVIPVSGDQGSCIGDTFDVLITVNPLASISNNLLNQELCDSNNSVAVTWTSFSAGATYSWKLVKSGSITGYTGDGAGNTLPSMFLGNNLHYPDTLRYAVSSTANECASPATNYDIIVNPDSKASYTYTKDTACWPFNINNTVINNISTFWVNDPTVPNDRFEWYAIDGGGNSNLIGNSRSFPGYTIPGPGDSILIKLFVRNKFKCKDDSVSHWFFTSPKPLAVFSLSPDNGCGPLTVSLTNQTALKDSFEYFWNFGNQQFSTLADPPPMAFLPDTVRFIDTTYYVVLRVNNECDTSYDSIPVTVNSKPKARFLPSSSKICSNTTIKLKNTSLGFGNTYEWHFNDGSPVIYMNDSSDVEHVYNSSSVITLVDTLIAINQCGRDTTTYPIVVTPINIKPNFLVTADSKAGCAAHTVTLQNLSTGGTRFEWFFAHPDTSIRQVTTTNTGTVTHTYTQSGRYLIKLRALNECSDTTDFDSVVVLRTPDPQFDFSSGSICVGQPVSFFNQTDTGNVYKWSFGTGDTSKAASPSYSFAAPGSYLVKLVAGLVDLSGMQCLDSIEKTVVIVDSLPGSFITSADTGYCTPFSVTFTNQSAGVGTPVWDFGDGSPLQYGNSVTHTYDSAGKFIALMRLQDPSGCKYGWKKDIIISAPYGALSYQGGLVCGNEAVRFEAVVFNTDSIEWDFGDGTTITTKSKIVYHSYSVPGQFNPAVSLISQGVNGICRINLPGNKVIKVDYLNAGFSHLATNYCDSTIVRFQDTSTAYSGIQSWVWNLGNGATLNSQSPAVKYFSSNNYPVKQVIQSNWGCSDTADLILPVVVHATPTADIIALNKACVGDTVSFLSNINSPDSVNLVKWEGVTAYYGKNIILPFSKPGSYDFRLVAGTIYGCFDTAGANIIIHPLPDLIAKENKTICLGQSTQLLAITNTANIRWTPVSSLSCSDCINPVATPSSSTSYVALATSNQGCRNADTVVIMVKLPIDIDVSGNDTICIGESTTLTVTGSGVVRYAWSPATSISCTDCTNPVVNPDASTRYMVVGYDSKNNTELCFTDTAYVEVTVGHYPIVKLPADTLIQTGSVLRPDPDITYGNGIVFEAISTYSWSPLINIDSANFEIPKITARNNICYKLDVENIYGCKSSDEYCIKVFCENSQVFIPNAFTPTQSSNRRFWVRTKGINKIKTFRVFNRWGEIVFEKNNFNPLDGVGVQTPPDDQGWDGKIRGVWANPDVYVYIVEVVCDNEVPFFYKGNVTLIR